MRFDQQSTEVVLVFLLMAMHITSDWLVVDLTIFCYCMYIGIANKSNTHSYRSIYFMLTLLIYNELSDEYLNGP